MASPPSIRRKTCLAGGEINLSEVDNDWPEEYIPKRLRKGWTALPRESSEFLCCRKNSLGYFTKVAGPFRQLADALEVIPEDYQKRSRIMLLNKDGTEQVVYRWNQQRAMWIRKK